MKFIVPLAIILCALPARAQTPLSVRVLDEGGAPIAGALVAAQIYAPGQIKPASQKTDGSGAAILALPEKSDGKAPAIFAVAGASGYSFGGARVPIGAQNTPLDIRLARGQSWRGKIVDEAGAPLANARISVYGARANRDDRYGDFLPDDALKAFYSAQSKADGSFEIAHLPAGKDLFYQISRAGFAAMDGQDGRTDNPQIFRLAPGGTLSGRALDANGQPLVGLQVFASVSQLPGSVGGAATTGADGAFTVEGLAPGVYQLSATFPADSPSMMPLLQGVKVVAGQAATASEWRAVEGAQIRGKVSDGASGKPIAGASFYASVALGERGQSAIVAQATSDQAGLFVLRVLPGQYRVSAGETPDGYLRAFADQKAEPTAEAPASVNFELQSAPIVRGITRDESGAPIQAQLLMDGRGYTLDTDAQGRWQFTAQYQEGDITFGGGEDEQGYFEIVTPKRVEFPVQGPIIVTVRRKPWQTLEGRVVTPAGAPIEGARVEAEFVVETSDSSWLGAKVSAWSDARGRYVLRRLRDSRQPNVGGTEVKVSARRAGFQFESGGLVTREGQEPRVSDLVFAPLSQAVRGTTQAGADVVVAGQQTRADDAGNFSFDALPTGQNQVYAAKGELFGSAPASQLPLAIALAPLTPQNRDENLARAIWENSVVDVAEKGVLDLEQWPGSTNFLGRLRRAQSSGNSSVIGDAFSFLQPSDAPESFAIAREIASEMAPSDGQTSAYLSLALATDDADLADRALELARAQFERPVANDYERVQQMARAAVLAERRNGTQAGALELRRALAYILKNHPEKSRFVGASQTVVGRNETLGRIAAPIVAQGSAALLRELLDNIETGSGFAIRARLDAIPVVAKARGYEAALPLLEELQQLPPTILAGETRYEYTDLDWALGSAVQSLMPFVGPNDAKLALELARKVVGNEQSGRALASAARVQSLDVAAPLLREAVLKVSGEDKPRIAAYAYERDAKLGLELFEIARVQAANTGKSPLNPNNDWIAFAFYYGRANPAGARLILEREWAKSLAAKVGASELATIAVAMASIDGARASQMASELAAQDERRALGAQIRIARFLIADEATRRGLTLGGAGARFAVGELQW